MLLLLLLSCFSRVRLRDPIDSSPPGSPIPGILQARTLEWVAISFTHAWKWKVKVAQSCLILWEPMDYSVHGILQARILEWVTIPFSRGSSQPRDQTQVSHITSGFFSSWATREDQTSLLLQVSLDFLPLHSSSFMVTKIGNQLSVYIRVTHSRDFPAGPVVKTPCFHFRGCEFDPWSGN